SVSWIKQQTKPFFLWLALNAPHTPFHRPPLNLISDKTLVDNQAAINSNPLPYYLASIEAMDKEIARLITSLTEEQRKNTIFIFMGDNGTPSRVAQKPFTRSTAKSSLFQGGINTPLIVSGRNVTRKNVTETAMVQATDMFATLADIATVSSGDTKDGQSILPLFNNANATKRTFAYSEFFGSGQSSNNGYTVRNGAYKFIHLENGKEYLFKISVDPFEFANLLDQALTGEAQSNLYALKLIKTKL
ncbi:MAG: sulfatase, partial [Pedobacter sp.]